MTMTMREARVAVAEAVEGTGLPCSPYPPDTVAPPVAFLDTMVLSYEASDNAWYCAPGAASLQLTMLEQRNDTGSAIAALEDRVPGVVDAVTRLGVSVISVSSGSVEVGGQSLPAVTFTLQAHLR